VLEPPPYRTTIQLFCINIVIDYNLYSILFTVCEVAFDNFLLKNFMTMMMIYADNGYTSDVYTW